MDPNIYQRFLSTLAFIVPGSKSLRPKIQRLRGVHIGKNVWIGQNVLIDEIHPERITIGDYCTIGTRTSIIAHFYWSGEESNPYAGPVVIEKGVFIGPHCVILPNVHIGEGAVIKAGTVVTKSVPPYVLWGVDNAGPLARITVPLTMEHSYEDFLHGLRPIRKKAPVRKNNLPDEN